MDDALAVSQDQRVHDRHEDRERLGRRERHVFLEARAQRSSLELLEDEVHGPVLFVAHVEDLDDVRVAEARSGTRLLEKASREREVAGVLRLEELHGDLASGPVVGGFEDDPCPAPADDGIQLIAAGQQGPDPLLLGENGHFGDVRRRLDAALGFKTR